MKNIINEDHLYHSPIFDLYHAKIQSPNTKEMIERDIIRHPDAVAILPYTIAKANPHKITRVLTTEEYRCGINKISTAIVAGLVEPKENPLTTTIRELKEEAGIIIPTTKLNYVKKINSSENFTDESVTVFVACVGTTSNYSDPKINFYDDIKFTKPHFDNGGEFVKTKWTTLNELSDHTNAAPSVVAVMYLESLSERGY
jgi:8-oxo-dGTP pyrophosphatase MutT (NUDIX family)